MSYAVLVTEERAFANWPTLDDAWACENCRGLFRAVDNLMCPHCGSESVFNAAAVLNREARVTGALLTNLRYFGRPAGRSGDVK